MPFGQGLVCLMERWRTACGLIALAIALVIIDHDINIVNSLHHLLLLLLDVAGGIIKGVS